MENWKKSQIIAKVFTIDLINQLCCLRQLLTLSQKLLSEIYMYGKVAHRSCLSSVVKIPVSRRFDLFHKLRDHQFLAEIWQKTKWEEALPAQKRRKRNHKTNVPYKEMLLLLGKLRSILWSLRLKCQCNVLEVWTTLEPWAKLEVQGQTNKWQSRSRSLHKPRSTTPVSDPKWPGTLMSHQLTCRSEETQPRSCRTLSLLELK